MTKSILTILLSVFIAFSLNAETDKDEFQHKMAKASELIKSNPKEALIIFQELQEEAIKENDGIREMEVSKKLAKTLYTLGVTRELPALYARIDSLIIENDIKKNDVRYEKNHAQFLLVTKDALGALQRLNKIKSDVLESDDTVLKIDWHVQMSTAYRHLEDIKLGLEHFLAADSLNKLIDNKFTSATVLRENADHLWGQGKKEEALDIFIRLGDFYVEKENFAMAVPLYTNVISLSMGTGEKQQAIEYSEKLAEIRKKFSTEIGYFAAEANRIFFLIQLEEYEKAKTQAEKTIALADSINRDDTHPHYLLGLAYRGLNQYDFASEEIKIAFDQSLKKGENGACVFYAHALYQTYLWKERFEEALVWHETYKQFTDSVYNEKNSKEIEVVQARFDAATSELEVENLNAKAKIEKQKKNQLWMALIFSIALFSGFIFYIFQSRKKARLLQENQVQILTLEKEKLSEKLEFKEKELVSQVLNITHKNALLQNIKEEVEKAQERSPQGNFKPVLREIDKSLTGDKEWSVFLESFSSLHSSFMDNLKALSSDLSSNEIRLASLLRMNMSGKEIANILNISTDGVKKARYRLRKKLNPDSDMNIQDYILSI